MISGSDPYFFNATSTVQYAHISGDRRKLKIANGIRSYDNMKVQYLLVSHMKYVDLIRC